MNRTDVGNAQIAKNEMTHNHPVLLSACIIPLTDLILLESNNSKMLPEVKKNEALASECPIK